MIDNLMIFVTSIYVIHQILTITDAFQANCIIIFYIVSLYMKCFSSDFLFISFEPCPIFLSHSPLLLILLSYFFFLKIILKFLFFLVIYRTIPIFLVYQKFWYGSSNNLAYQTFGTVFLVWYGIFGTIYIEIFE